MVPGGQGWYVAGNGRLTQARDGGAAPVQRGPGPQPAAFRPQVPPPAIQPQVGAAPVQGQQQGQVAAAPENQA